MIHEMVGFHTPKTPDLKRASERAHVQQKHLTITNPAQYLSCSILEVLYPSVSLTLHTLEKNIVPLVQRKCPIKMRIKARSLN